MTARRRILVLLAAVVPVAIAAVVALVLAAGLGDPFATVPVHWNAAGEPDGWGPAWSTPVTVLVIGVVLSALLALCAAGLWRQQRESRRDAAPLDLARSERAVWIGHVVAPVGAIVLLSAVVVLAAVALVFAVAALGGVALWLAIVPVLVGLAGVTAMWARVRVDAEGLDVRCGVGLPRFRVPIGDIVAAGTTDVRPLVDFGGWGWRWGPQRRFGVVLRAGGALEVERRDGRRFVVTVDDADAAASLLAASIARFTDSRPSHG